LRFHPNKGKLCANPKIPANMSIFRAKLSTLCQFVHIPRECVNTLLYIARTTRTHTQHRRWYCGNCIVLVKRLRRTENVRGTFEGVSAPRESLQPSLLQGHRIPY
jgi:hypothetical protein